KNQPVLLQLGFESSAPGQKFSLLQTIDQLTKKSGILYDGAVRWAKYLGSKNVPVYLRPMSEMNDNAAGWQLGPEARRAFKGNSPATFVKTWTLLRQLF